MMKALTLDSFTMFGDLLRHLRQRERLTQRELGQAVGYGEAQINRLESGVRLPDVGLVVAQFIPALHLQDWPEAAAQLVKLAAQARGEPVPTAFTFARPAQHEIVEDLGVMPRKQHSNVPAQVTTFIGRENEIDELVERVQIMRVLTLTGSGGCGKTRLAIEIATRAVASQSFPDGVWLIELAPLTDASLVPRAVAAVFKLPDVTGEPIIETLTNFLATKHALLILDNCEHLIEACAQLAERLLRECAGVHLLATSRESLRIAGEVNWRVPSLPQGDSIHLFVERARAVRPDFTLTDQNRSAVTRICQQLDGIPLAIELAVARLNALSPEQIVERLNDRFAVLVSRQRTAIPRHQTLRATILWSFNLLTSPEQALLARLSVFVCGLTAEAAEAIFDDANTLDVLSNLVDKSLVIADVKGDAVHYHMLETIRQFAQEQLKDKDAGEETAMRHRHLEYFVKLAEQAEIEMRGEMFRGWVIHLEREYDNLRQALTWSHDSNRGVLGLRLIGALWQFIMAQDHIFEAADWIEKLLCVTDDVPVAVRAKILYGISICAWRTGEWQNAISRARESLALCRELNDPIGIAISLVVLGDQAARRQLDCEKGQAMLEEALSLLRAAQHLWGIGFASIRLGRLLIMLGADEQANALLDESIALAETMDPLFLNDALIQKTLAAFARHDFAEADVLLQRRSTLALGEGLRRPRLGACREMGHVALLKGNHALATTLFEEQLALALEYSEEAGHPMIETGSALMNLGLVSRLQGNLPVAMQRFHEAMERYRRAGDAADFALVELQLGYTECDQHNHDAAMVHFRKCVQWCLLADNRPRLIVALTAIAELRRTQGDGSGYMRLCGFAAKFSRATVLELLPGYLIDYEGTLSGERTALADPALAAAWAEGARMTLDEAVQFALTMSASG